jgi:CspA family cold shock protein
MVSTAWLGGYGSERGMVAAGDVDEDRGVLASAELPPGYDAWVLFRAIEVDGYRSLTVGALVDFDFEAAMQDGWQYRVTRVRQL